MAGGLLGSDRASGAVPAAVSQRGAAGGAAGVAGRVPGSGGADRRPHDRAHRAFADRAGVAVAACARGRGMTEQATAEQAGVLARILDYANRADPYPLYAELRKTPVFRAPNGAYVVSTYREIWALMHDPRIGVSAMSAGMGGGMGGGAGAGAGSGTAAGAPGGAPGVGGGAFIGMAPPAHDRLRRLATSHFEQTEAVRPGMLRT